jgi:hypothetical protein
MTRAIAPQNLPHLVSNPEAGEVIWRDDLAVTCLR